MSCNNTNGNVEEQEVCIRCGFCCDGTLFDHAIVYPNEVIREDLKKNLFTVDEDQFFSLPCPHSNTSCQVYNEKKPQICSKFSCQVLRNLREGILSKLDAIEIINQTRSLREEVFELYKTFSDDEKPYFKQIVDFVYSKDDKESVIYQTLKMKTIILNSLLIKEFKSKEEFNDLMML